MKIPENWKLNPKTGRYDVSGTVYQKDLKSFVQDGKFVIAFGHVSGDFNCFVLGLKTLKGVPQKVNGSFNCSQNELETLEDGPEFVGEHYNCSANSLVTLKGAPKNIRGFFGCSVNSLITLEGAPYSVNRFFECSDNPLESLEGCPQNAKKYLWNKIWYSSFEEFQKVFVHFQIIEKSKKLLEM